MRNKSGTGVTPLPQGGGALQGIGETFSPDLFTGTGNFSAPVVLPPGRNSFQPQEKTIRTRTICSRPSNGTRCLKLRRSLRDWFQRLRARLRLSFQLQPGISNPWLFFINH
jgi:hypothetical protein